MKTSLAVLALLCMSTGAHAQDSETSVARGEHIAFIAGCHDCHSAGYAMNGGKLDPATALQGNPVGFDGPWGTTFAPNLRIVASKIGENEFVGYMKTIETRPPMPWFSLHHFTESESRSLHRYIVSLGEIGEQAPAYIPPTAAKP